MLSSDSAGKLYRFFGGLIKSYVARITVLAVVAGAFAGVSLADIPRPSPQSPPPPPPPPQLLNTFVANGAPVGYLFAIQEPAKPDAYISMEIRDRASDTYRVLYRIERWGFYFADGQLDLSLSVKDGAHGFFLSGRTPNSVTIGCCKFGKPLGASMEALTVAWNASVNRFEWRPAR